MLNESMAQVTRLSFSGFSVRVWDRVPGRERVYLTLNSKRNGGSSWNGGIGREDYYDVTARRWVESRPWAGAATRDAFESRVADVKSKIVSVLRGESAAEVSR